VTSYDWSNSDTKRLRWKTAGQTAENDKKTAEKRLSCLSWKVGECKPLAQDLTQSTKESTMYEKSSEKLSSI
jgi:hypothetical protein